MLTTLLPSIHKTAELVQEISAASHEQSTGVEQINTAIQQLDNVTQQNAITSESVAAAAEELAAQAEQLRNAMQFFKTLEPELHPPHQMPLPAGMPVAQLPQGLTTLRGERPRASIQRKSQESGVASRSGNIPSEDWAPRDLVAPTAYAADKPVKIAYFVSDLKVGFHQAQAYWAKIYAKEKYGADVQIFDGKSDNATMIANLNQLIPQGMDLATLHIWQTDAAKPGIEAALKKGITMASFFGVQAVEIPVVRHDEASVSFQMGKIAAEQWKKAYHDKPIVFVELGWTDNKAVIEGRTNPFVAGVLSVDPAAKNLGSLDASKGAEVAKKIIQDLIRAHPDLCIIYSEAANLTDGTIPGLKAVGRGKMKDGVPLTEIVASVDCPETEIYQIYDPNSSLKMSLALPPKETGMFRIDNLMDIRNGKIPQVDPANQKAYYIPASLVSYWNMQPDEAIKWYNDEFQANIKLPEYK
jgi:ABC-type sugar transport system substrate-binding protein